MTQDREDGTGKKTMTSPVTLEWVCLPDGRHFRTICRDGVPLYEPTEYLLSFVASTDSSTRTVETYGQRLVPFFVWLERKGIPLDAVTLQHLKFFRAALSAVDATQPPLLQGGPEAAATTKAQTFGAVVRFLSWAMVARDVDPLLGVRVATLRTAPRVSFSRLSPTILASLGEVPATRPKRVHGRHLNQMELDACRRWIMAHYAFNAALQVRNRAIFEVMWDGALRRGALLGLRSAHIDWHARTLLVSSSPEDVRDAWSDGRRNSRAAKTGEYLVLISDHTLHWLDRYRQEARPVAATRLGHGIFFCKDEPGMAKHGQPLTRHDVEYLFKVMSRPVAEGGSGVHVTPHALRRTWGAMATNDGVPREIIQSHLGHASIASTEPYTALSPERWRAALQAWRAGHPERYGSDAR